MIITSKYNIGDTVLAGHVESTSYWETCPECDGKGYHKVEGKDLTIRCKVCNTGESWQSSGKILRRTWAPLILTLTIGQVRGKATVGKIDEIEYMCEETGIGNGKIWREEILYPESYRETLEAVLKEKARINNDETIVMLFGAEATEVPE